MGKEKKKVRIPKKMPAWMEAMFIYVAKKDGASPRAYKPIMGLVETHWDAFVEECSAPPAPRAKKTPVKKDDSSDEGHGDDDATDAVAAGAGDEGSTETQFDPDDLQEATDGDLDGDNSNTPMVDPEEQARIDEMVRDGIKSMPEPLRQSLRKAYGPPRTPTASLSASKAPLGPGWRHAEKQADDLYGTFCSEAATVGVPQDHPMALSVSNLYSLAKGAIAARSSTPA